MLIRLKNIPTTTKTREGRSWPEEEEEEEVKVQGASGWPSYDSGAGKTALGLLAHCLAPEIFSFNILHPIVGCDQDWVWAGVEPR